MLKYMKWSCFIFAVALTGCDTYGPMKSHWNGPVGYSETKLADNQYKLEYKAGNGNWARHALEGWHRRAAELCMGRGYEADVVAHNNTYQTFNVVAKMNDTNPSGIAVGTVTCK